MALVRVCLAVALIVLGGASAAVAAPTASDPGAAGTACTAGSTGNITAADLWGNITRCNGSTWIALTGPSNTTVAASGTTGSIQYNSGGLLAGDSNILWNAASRNMAISGTLMIPYQNVYAYYKANSVDAFNSPLYINYNSTSNTLINANGGNVGIGLTNPTFQLTVAKDSAYSVASAPFGDFQQNGQFVISAASGSNLKRLAMGVDTVSNPMVGVIQAIEATIAVRSLALNPSGGNVGIGTTAPTSLLTVSGSMNANSITAGLSGDGFGHAFLSPAGDTVNAGYTAYFLPNGARLGYTGFGTIGGMNIATDHSTPLNIVTSSSLAMTILPNGTVGIGTAGPNNTTKLNMAGDYAGSGGGQLLITGISAPTKQVWLGEDTTDNIGVLQAYTQGVGGQPFVIQPQGGNVGIGASNPLWNLQVGTNTSGLTNAALGATGPNALFLTSNDAGISGNAYFSGNWKYNANGYAQLITFSSADGSIQFQTGSTSTGTAGSTVPFATRLSILTTGNATLAGTLTQNSDRRLKTNIAELAPDVFEKLALIKGVTFNWKDKKRDPRQQIGVIAQDVQKAYPQLVTADASGTLSVNYSGLVAPLIEATKQLKAKSDADDTRLAKLEASNVQLQREVGVLMRQGRSY